jgi:hypothetical protein
MPVVKVDLDAETYARLADQAVAERRPIVWQAEVTLRRAVGLPFPRLADRAQFPEAGGPDGAR